MSLRRFLSLGLIAVFLCGSLTAAALFNSTASNKRAIEKLTESVESAASAQLILTNLSIHRRQALLRDLKISAERREQTESAKKNLLEASEELAKSATTAEEAAIIEVVRKSTRAYLENYDRVRRNGASGSKLYVSVAEEFYKTQDAVQNLTKFNLDEANSLQADSLRQERINSAMVIFSFVLLTSAVFVLFFGVRKLFYRPVVRLNRAIEDFEIEQTIPAVDSKGAFEIRTIWKSFSKLATHLARQKDAQLTFLASIAHDLKNPLGAIKMSAELIAEDEKLSDESKEMLKIVSRQTQHLSRLINDLLDTTRIESGHIDLQIKLNDLSEIVRESAQLHSGLSNRHRIEVEVPSSPVNIMCDEQRLSQVFNNLFNNALKYSPDGGRISAKIRSDQDTAIIEISDEGVGIPEDDIGGIFEPFRRSSNTRGAIPGIGLGLSVSRKIVRGHGGGDISVSSKPGAGTTFSVQLPVTPAP